MASFWVFILSFLGEFLTDEFERMKWNCLGTANRESTFHCALPCWSIHRRLLCFWEGSRPAAFSYLWLSFSIRKTTYMQIHVIFSLSAIKMISLISIFWLLCLSLQTSWTQMAGEKKKTLPSLLTSEVTMPINWGWRVKEYWMSEERENVIKLSFQKMEE